MNETHNPVTWDDVLERLRRPDARITDYGDPVGPILFDRTLHSGTSHRIEARVFAFLCEQGWIETPDEGRIRHFTITATGIARLNAAARTAGE